MALPPVTPLTLQMTPGVEVLLTVAVNCCVSPRNRGALVGNTVTLTGGAGVEEDDEPPPQPVANAPTPRARYRRVSKRWLCENVLVARTPMRRKCNTSPPMLLHWATGQIIPTLLDVNLGTRLLEFRSTVPKRHRPRWPRLPCMCWLTGGMSGQIICVWHVPK